jgi:hypothetical protein
MPSRRGRCEEQLSGEGGGILFSFFFPAAEKKMFVFRARERWGRFPREFLASTSGERGARVGGRRGGQPGTSTTRG